MGTKSTTKGFNPKVTWKSVVHMVEQHEEIVKKGRVVENGKVVTKDKVVDLAQTHNEDISYLAEKHQIGYVSYKIPPRANHHVVRELLPSKLYITNAHGKLEVCASGKEFLDKIRPIYEDTRWYKQVGGARDGLKRTVDNGMCMKEVTLDPVETSVVDKVATDGRHLVADQYLDEVAQKIKDVFERRGVKCPGLARHSDSYGHHYSPLGTRIENHRMFNKSWSMGQVGQSNIGLLRHINMGYMGQDISKMPEDGLRAARRVTTCYMRTGEVPLEVEIARESTELFNQYFGAESEYIQESLNEVYLNYKQPAIKAVKAKIAGLTDELAKLEAMSGDAPHLVYKGVGLPPINLPNSINELHDAPVLDNVESSCFGEPGDCSAPSPAFGEAGKDNPGFVEDDTPKHDFFGAPSLPKSAGKFRKGKLRNPADKFINKLAPGEASHDTMDIKSMGDGMTTQGLGEHMKEIGAMLNPGILGKIIKGALDFIMELNPADPLTKIQDDATQKWTLPFMKPTKVHQPENDDHTPDLTGP